jgi:hypothetical protein
MEIETRSFHMHINLYTITEQSVHGPAPCALRRHRDVMEALREFERLQAAGVS